MSSKPKILYVLSSHQNGWYLPEFAHPYQVLSPHTETVVASPKGKSVVDIISTELFKDDAYCQEFYATKSSLWTTTMTLSSHLGHAGDFDLIFIVGGFGPMYDLATDETTIKLIREFHDAGKLIVALCHGVAALVHVKLGDGSYLINGQRVTGFSDQEEVEAYANKVAPPEMPFHLEQALNQNSGGHYEKADKSWAPHVVVASPKLLIGQNPASAHPLGVEVLKVLQGKS